MNALAPVKVAAPATRLLTVDEARAQCKIDTNASDAELAAFVLAAEQHFDGYAGIVGQALITQTWRRSFDSFPCGNAIRLPLGPIQSVSSVKYWLDGSEGTFSSASYHVVSDVSGPMNLLKDGETWPNTETRPDAVTIEWVCGFGDDPADVPAPIIHAAKLLVAHFNENREAIGSAQEELPFSVRHLISPFSKVGA